jgi:hypothetical protein
MCVIPINFTTHQNFSIFVTGTGRRNLTYSLNYTAPNITNFLENITAIISFNRINASFQNYYSIKSFVHEVTSTQVVFSLETDSTTKFFALAGTILLLTSETQSNIFNMIN